MARPGRRNPTAPDGFSDLYRRHVRAVYAFLAYSVSREHAEDLTSTTFERALRAYDRFDPQQASERTWLLAIARNALTDHYRRQSHRTTTSTDAHPALLDRLIDTDDPLGRHASADAVVAWLSQLPPRQREVLALRFGADLSARDVADHLGLSEDNVHQIASRALRALRAAADPTLNDSA